MTNEIKFDHFKDLEELKRNVDCWIAEDEMYWERWFGLGDIKTLLDYITNLQEENKHLDKVNCQLRKKINNDIYKSRIDKAIEYNNHLIKDAKYHLNLGHLKKMNKILQGDPND